jgi:hypothetical protein
VKSERESGMEKNDSEIIIYRTEDGATKIDVRLDENSVWLTQSDLVELFQSSKSNISEHIKHIFEERELNETAVVRKFRTTAPDGKNYNVAFYNLDVIISVGYRVKSLRGVQFRIWATERLREYLIKGFSDRLARVEQMADSIGWGFCDYVADVVGQLELELGG